MSGSVDALVTVALFVLGAPVFGILGFTGFYRLGVEIGPRLAQPPRFYNALALMAEIVPPLTLAVSYAVGVLLANVVSGLTFYIPLIALTVGAACWGAALNGLIGRLRDLRSGQRTVEDVAFDRRRQAGQQRDSGTSSAQDASGPAIRDRAHAISAVIDYLRRNGIDYPTTDLVADRFEAGWSVYAPVRVDTNDPDSFLDVPVGRAVFLIGDGGRIEQASTSQPPELARQRFAEQERLRRRQ